MRVDENRLTATYLMASRKYGTLYVGLVVQVRISRMSQTVQTVLIASKPPMDSQKGKSGKRILLRMGTPKWECEASLYRWLSQRCAVARAAPKQSRFATAQFTARHCIGVGRPRAQRKRPHGEGRFPSLRRVADSRAGKPSRTGVYAKRARRSRVPRHKRKAARLQGRATFLLGADRQMRGRMSARFPKATAARSATPTRG